MQRKILILMALAITILSLSVKLPNTLSAGPAPLAPPIQAASNSALIDITVSDAGDLSVGGINLSALGVDKLEGPLQDLAQNLEHIHLTSDTQVVTLDLQGTEFAKMDWTPATRQTVLNLATRYGVQLQPEVQARLEEWIASTTLDLTARFANEVSKPLTLSLSKLLLVETQPNGQVVLETIPLPATLDPNTLQMLQRAGNQATVCWNKGVLTAAVDGAEMPTVTLTREGVLMLTQVANVPVDNNAASAVLLGSRLGVDLTLPGGSHATGVTCPE